MHSQYAEILRPLDLYSVPAGTKEVMTRDQLYRMILSRNLAIKLSHQDTIIADENLNLTYDNFNIPKPTLTLGLTDSSSVSYPIPGLTNVYSSLYQKNYSLGLALTGATEWGFSYSLNLPSLSFTQGTGVSPNNQLSSFQYGAVGLGLSLLRNSIFFVGRIPKTQADISYETQKESDRSTTLQTIQTGEQNYYDVLQKQLQVRVLENAVKLAEALVSDVKEMVKAGESERLAIVKAELQLAQSQTSLLQARNDLTNSRQVFYNLLALKEEAPADLFPDPNQLREAPVPPSLSIPELIAHAKAHRPDYLSAKLRRTSSELAVDQAFAAVLPQLDLTGAYTYTGTNTSVSSSVNDSLHLAPPQYSVGIKFSYSFTNDSDKTSYRVSKINLMKSDLSVQQLDSQVSKEVTTAAQNIQIDLQRLKAAELARKLSEQKLSAEFEKFRVGESNVRDVIDFQTEVNSARITEVSTRIGLLNDLTNLHTAIGELPEGLEARLKQ